MGQVIIKMVAEQLDDAKADKVADLRAEAGRRFMGLLGVPTSAPEWVAETLFGMLQMIDNSYQRNPPLDPDLVKVGQLKTAFKDARAEINNLTDKTSIEAYDVVNTPNWP